MDAIGAVRRGEALGEKEKRPFQLSFNSSLRVDFQGARVMIKHARFYWLLLAESHLTRRLFAGMVRRIALLPSSV